MRFTWNGFKAVQDAATVTLTPAPNPNPGSTSPNWLATTSIVITFGSAAVASKFMSEHDPNADFRVVIDR